MKVAAYFVLLFSLCVLVACKQGTQTNCLHELPVACDRIKLDVVHILQLDDYSCATTSVAMALSYFEKKVLDKDVVWKISGSSISEAKEYGNDMNGLQKIAKHYGYESEFKEGISFEDLERFLSCGIPVVINVLQSVESNATHAVLVVGYDRKKKIFFINDPAQYIIGESISYKKLNELWSAYVKAPGEMTYEMAHRSGFIIYFRYIFKKCAISIIR